MKTLTPKYIEKAASTKKVDKKTASTGRINSQQQDSFGVNSAAPAFFSRTRVTKTAAPGARGRITESFGSREPSVCAKNAAAMFI